MIRVLIERHYSEGMEEELRRVEREARQEAIHVPGYISGESLRNRSDPQVNVVISTWRALEDWEGWYASEARSRVLERIAPLLLEPERITVLEPL